MIWPATETYNIVVGTKTWTILSKLPLQQTKGKLIKIFQDSWASLQFMPKNKINYVAKDTLKKDIKEREREQIDLLCSNPVLVIFIIASIYFITILFQMIILRLHLYNYYLRNSTQ